MYCDVIPSIKVPEDKTSEIKLAFRSSLLFGWR